MRQRNLGRSGLQVSVIGLGCNNFGGRVDLEASRKVVHKALDLGITLLDVADVYGGLGGGHLGASEECLGQILGARRTISCWRLSSASPWMRGKCSKARPVAIS